VATETSIGTVACACAFYLQGAAKRIL